MTAPLEKPLLEQERTKSIIGAFYAVYNALGRLPRARLRGGPGEGAVATRPPSRTVKVPVDYMGEIAAHQRLEIVVDDCDVVEIKASEQQPPIAERQS